MEQNTTSGLPHTQSHKRATVYLVSSGHHAAKETITSQNLVSVWVSGL